MTREKINKGIGELKENIEIYRSSLDKESVWLFLATVACYEMDSNFQAFKAFAFLVTLSLFGKLAKKKLNDKRPFKNVLISLRNDVNMLTDKVEKDELLKELNEVDRKYINISLGAAIEKYFYFFLVVVFYLFAVAISLNVW